MKTSARNQQIDEILKDLRSFPKTTENEYAIEKNIEFFEATRSVFKYIVWLITKAPKIDGSRLLELSDFPFEKWDHEMHTNLVALQKKNFPGLVKPIVSKIVELIEHQSEEILILGNFGSGGMEIEYQIIMSLVALNSKKKVVFVGFDIS